MNEQNSTLKVIGPIIGVLILAYVVNLGFSQFNRDSAALSEQGIAAMAEEGAVDEEVSAEDAAEEDTTAEETESAEDAVQEDSTAEEAEPEEVMVEESADEEVMVEDAAEEDVVVEEVAEDASEEESAAADEVTEDGAVAVAAPSGGEPVMLDVQAGDLFFGEPGSNNLVDTPIWTVGSSQEIALSFQNNGGVQHNWAVLNQDVTEVPIPFFEDENADLLFYNPGLQDAGTTFEATITAPAELGEYLVICTAPGHYPLMQGRLVVE